MNRRNASPAVVPCSIEGCEKRRIARGLCSLHYERQRRTGSTDLRPEHSACTVVDCSRPTRSRFAKHCETHYYRLRRTGSVAAPERVGQCQTHGCENRGSRSGLCRMHRLRLIHRGDLSFECKADNHPSWTGDHASYDAIHQRLRALRGRASGHECVDCAGPARQWSYDHTDPNERLSDLGPYSVDLAHYHPRCVSCHKSFDLNWIANNRRSA